MDTELYLSFHPARNSKRKLRTLCILPCFYIFIVFVTLMSVEYGQKENSENHKHTGRHVLESKAESTNRCIPSSMESFPDDFLTQDQRLNGGVIIHFLIMFYTCAMLAIICADYFLPSLDIISEKLKLPSDVAGATFMAIGTSTPELFSSVIGAFITEGDIGVGTIVGSAVFNVFGVTGLAGIAVWQKDIIVDWYPVTRDTSVYLLTIAALTLIISDNIVTWWESLILIVMFCMYVVLMYSNSAVEIFCREKMNLLRSKLTSCFTCLECGETTSLLVSENDLPQIRETVKPQKCLLDSNGSFSSNENPETVVKAVENEAIREMEEAEKNQKESSIVSSLCLPPNGRWKFIVWLIMWPASLLFQITIPDSRKEKWKKFYVITFLSSTIWLGVTSYLCVWMVTIIGYTLSIPDTVSGLTILAIGTSLPEILTSVIVARNGLGNMVMANLIGSNVFDILFCLGVPWLIKTLISPEGNLIINSSALTYTSTTLLTTVVGLILVFTMSGWKLNYVMGFACIALYIFSATFCCLYELNVFGYLNPASC